MTSSTTSGGSTQQPPLSLFRIGLLVLVLVTGAWRWWTISHWSWFADDWIYLDQTQSMGFLEYVFQGYNSHLMPGQFLLTWILTEAAPLDYGWAALLLTVFAVASLLAWAAAFREIFGERVQLLFPLALIAISPLLLMPIVWWASGLQVLPLQLSMGLSVLFLARYLLRGHRRRDLVGLTVCYGLGLFFWQKALLIVIPLVLVGWLLSTGPSRQRIASLARTLAVPAVVSALYAVVYLMTRRSGALDIPRTQFAPRSSTDWWRFISTSTRDVGFPTLVGGPFERMTDAWDTYDPVSGSQALALTGLFLVIVTLAVALRRNSVPAVACLVVYALVTWGLVVMSARFILDGSDGMGRYAADIVPVAALAIAFITTRTILEPEGSALRRQLPGPALGVGRGVLGVIGACIVAAMVVVNVTTWWVARESSPRPWVDAVVADSKRAGDATLVNVSSPVNVIHPILFMEYATLSRMLGPLHLPLTFDQPSPLLLVPDAQGHLMEADVVDLAAQNRPTDNPTCGFLVRPGRTTTIPMTIPLYPFGWGVRLDYFAELPTDVQVRTDSQVVDLDLAEGLRRVQFKVAGAVTSLKVSAPESASPVCVTQVFVGGFGASDRSPWQ